jgi:hypothetical protein
MQNATGVCFGNRVADLREERQRTFGRKRAETTHHRLQVNPAQQLHRVERHSGSCDSGIEDANGVRRAQRRGDTRFGLELRSHEVGAARRQPVGACDLDRGVAIQRQVTRAPDVRHTSATEPVNESVAANLLHHVRNRRIGDAAGHHPKDTVPNHDFRRSARHHDFR